MSLTATSHELADQYAVWAPLPDEVRLVIAHNGEETLHEMSPAEGGWWVCRGADVPRTAGTRYGYQLRSGEEWSKTLPDPRSTSQPDGVHGLSELTSPDFAWTDDAWTGLELSEMVIYELHVGTFAEEGTFAGVVDKLGYLKDLGVNAIELLPVQPFGGERNWGYDGVEWHAVHAAYGGREGIKQLVDAAHNAGIAIILDVVYNHFGPDGNYNGMFGPYTSGGNTGWGELVNFSNPDSDEVRAYVLDTVDQWLGEFRIDGLRLDAVHSFDDRGAYSIMEQMQQVADEVAAIDGPMAATAWPVSGSTTSTTRCTRSSPARTTPTTRTSAASTRWCRPCATAGTSPTPTPPTAAARTGARSTRSASPLPSWSPTRPPTTRPATAPPATAPP